jgi:hypothetical protein
MRSVPSIASRLSGALRASRSGSERPTGPSEREGIVYDRELSSALDAAIRDTLRRLDRAIDLAAASGRQNARTRDDLERVIFDIKDLALQDKLRRLLQELDDGSDDTPGAIEALDLYQCLDPIRCVASDLASGFLRSPALAGASPEPPCTCNRQVA